MRAVRVVNGFVVVLLAGAACGGRSHPAPIDNRAGGAATDDKAGADALPADVQALIDRWESCQHWSGEEPYDRERARDIAAAIDDSCPGNEETRAELERRYADRPAILARLRQLDE
jgi:hypothetical protein